MAAAVEAMSAPAAKKILVLGDSHANVFASPQFARKLPNWHFEVVFVPGATVSGLPNPNAKTQALPIFQAALAASDAKTVIVQMGEVDTGFVIWYRAEKYGVAVEEMLAQALGNYQRLLASIAAKFRCICVSAPLPTIRDGVTAGEVASARSSIKANQRQRTALTLEFNRQMQAWCQANGIACLMLDAASLGEDGLLRSELRNKNEGNHHYDTFLYGKMIIQHLQDLL